MWSSWGLRQNAHDPTDEKPSFLLFRKDYRYPTDVAVLLSADTEADDTGIVYCKTAGHFSHSMSSYKVHAGL